MNFEDYETLPTTDVSTHMMAGAIAGLMEHCVMYPLDSVKVNQEYSFNIKIDRKLVYRYLCLRKMV